MKSPAYTPIETEDSDTQDECSIEHNGSFTEKKFMKTPRRIQVIHIIVFVQSVLLLCSCTLLVKTWNPGNLSYGSFQTGWRKTELNANRIDAAFDSIRLQKMTVAQPSDQTIGPPQSKYVGEPSEQLDNEWRILVAPTVLDLNDNEIGNYAGQTTKTELGWTSGLQVYHSLHCINALRRAVYQHIYGAPSKGALFHLDMLRLSSQCQSDLTPMLYYNYNGTMGIKPHEHTCRDFDAIHQWAKARSRCGDDDECAIMLGKQVGGEM
ncbi:hypothetical protein LZ32DRAFT_622202 [Colletotrichum eremochloae]|nr:hypothetical protein LZ32DRAFT_622202 [Colletotrichum eremochloae]